MTRLQTRPEHTDGDVHPIVHRLRRTIGGGVHLPGEGAYDSHRRVVSPVVDAHPVAVVAAESTSDLRAGLLAARDHDLPVAVQATGHGTHVPADGGVLLKTTAMNALTIDPDRGVARVGPGTLWGDVVNAAAQFGLAPLSGSSAAVGVAGFTLGGGVGWLSRRHGFAADSMLRAELLTADGELLSAGAGEHDDLHWALRGGGANFGIVTALEFRLYPVARVYGGISYFPVDRAGQVLATYRDWAERIPDEMSTAVVLTKIPDTAGVVALRGTRALAVKVLYAGPADDAETLLRPIRAAAGPAMIEGYRSMGYADAAMGGTPSRYLDYFAGLSDAVTDLVAASAVADPAAPTVEIRHWAGAMARPGPDAGPVGHRSAPFSIIVDDARSDLATSLTPHGLGATFLNFLADPARTAAAYTEADHGRLRTVKAAYDPDNVFSVNLNIPPA